MILYADTPGERLDAFLSRSVEDLSRSAAQKLLEEGCVKRNGKPGKKNDRLEPGDAIDVTIPEPELPAVWDLLFLPSAMPRWNPAFRSFWRKPIWKNMSGMQIL